MKEIKKQFARTLRMEQTPAEEEVWELLRNRKCFGLKFRRQHVVEGFVVDFYCHEQRLGIEIDGGIHKKTKDYDEIRQEMIESKSTKLIRINNYEIQKDKTVVLRKIKEALKPLLSE
jgi:adenine-specific DNA-methyltransferase